VSCRCWSSRARPLRRDLGTAAAAGSPAVTLGTFAAGTRGAGWTGIGATCVVLRIVNVVSSMRVSAAVELEGLDVPEFGMPAYPEDMVGAEA
jgi:ammonia channel protein AmtB